MPKIWKIKKPNKELQDKLSCELNVPDIVAQVLINRGIVDIEAARHFLSAEVSDLHDPFLLMDMYKAISRIKTAKEKNEKILIFGDYDVDGVTSSALLYSVLDEMGIEVIIFVATVLVLIMVLRKLPVDADTALKQSSGKGSEAKNQLAEADELFEQGELKKAERMYLKLLCL